MEANPKRVGDPPISYKRKLNHVLQTEMIMNK